MKVFIIFLLLFSANLTAEDRVKIVAPVNEDVINQTIEEQSTNGFELVELVPLYKSSFSGDLYPAYNDERHRGNWKGNGEADRIILRFKK